MYRLLRNLHLGAGLFAAVFLVAFGLSAAQMAWPIVVPPQRTADHDVTVPDSVEPTPRALALWLGQVGRARELAEALLSRSEVAADDTLRAHAVGALAADPERRHAMAAQARAKAEAEIKAMCDKLLANTVIEEYRYELG